MSRTLVIVESPAKARTIERILKTGYDVRASYGHVRDLPESADEIPDEIRKKKWGRLGVDTDGDFTPYYVIPNDKRKYVQALKAALKGASEVFLATDPDREGESISWHLKEILKPKVPVKRIVFHEITEDAIQQAVKDAHDVERESRAGAGEPPHSRSLVRLHGVAGALEEGADRPERRPRAERGGAADRRSRRRAPGVQAGDLLGSRSSPLGRRARVHGHARARRHRARRDREGLRLDRRAAPDATRACCRKPTASRSSTRCGGTCRGPSRRSTRNRASNGPRRRSRRRR